MGIGAVADRFSHKVLLLFGIGMLLLGKAAFLFIEGTYNYYAKITSFILMGVGFAVFDVITFVQVRLFVWDRGEKAYQRWYFVGQLCFSYTFGVGRLMVTASLALVPESSWLHWRLPWLVQGAVLALAFVLILLFGRFRSPIKARKEGKASALGGNANVAETDATASI